MRPRHARGERRRAQHAALIALALERCGVDAAPADCSEGLVCVVILHDGEPDPDARDAIEAEPGAWEEKLTFEGRQIPHAVAQARELDPKQDDRETALAVMRTAQDVDTWL